MIKTDNIAPQQEHSNTAPSRSSTDRTDERGLEWITLFLSEYQEFVENDDLGTLCGECGTVLLSSIVFGTWCAETLASLTCFPVGYVSAVKSIVDTNRFSESDAFCALARTFGSTPDDLPAIHDVMKWVNEEFWHLVPPDALPSLESLRRGVLFGGRVQNWVDQDALCYFDLHSQCQMQRPTMVCRCAVRRLALQGSFLDLKSH
jgi:hypothetical protein